MERYENEIDWSMIKFPVDVFCDTHTKTHLFKSFEETNDISINIFSVSIDNFNEFQNKTTETPQKETVYNDDNERVYRRGGGGAGGGRK